MSENDELGDFDDYGDSPESDEDPTDEEQNTDEERFREVYDEMVDLIPPGELGDTDPREVAEAAAKVVSVADEDEGLNPLDLDPRVGDKDLCFDRAKPGAKVYVVDVLAESVPEYYEEFPDAPALDEYAGNVVVRMDEEDAVFACVYVKDSLTSVDTAITAYPMPESRLTRYPAEQASMVGGASVEFERTALPGETHRLDLAEPEEIPEDADRDEDGEAELRADGGVSEDTLREATEEFFEEDDIESVGYAPDDDRGMVVVEVEEEDAGFGQGDTFDLLEFEETLNSHGFTHTGYAPAPGMTQINVAAEGEE